MTFMLDSSGTKVLYNKEEILCFYTLYEDLPFTTAGNEEQGIYALPILSDRQSSYSKVLP